MSVKKQFPSLCKLYSFYEEIPEEFLDETDVDSYFHHNIFDNVASNSASQLSLQRKILCNQVVPILRFKDTATLYPSKRSEDLQKRTHLFGRKAARFSEKI